MNKEWGRGYMTPEQRDLEKYDEGRQKGRLEANDTTVSTINELQRKGVSAEGIVNRLLKEFARK